MCAKNVMKILYSFLLC